MPPVKKWSSFAAPSELFRPVRDRYSRRRPLISHTHEYMEITWIDSGRALHSLNGREQIMEPRDIVFIRASDIHGLMPLDTSPLDLTNIAIPMAEFRHLARRYPAEIEWIFRPREPLGFSTRLEPGQYRVFNRWVNELFEAKRDQAFIIDRFVLNVLAELAPHAEAPDLPPDAPEWLCRAWREIQRPEFFSQGVGALFRLAARSREHTARALRRYFGVTPSQCVRSARLKHAARQLEMSTREILDIALECGFRDLSHFYKAFKAGFGTTPRRYRAAHRIG